MELEIALDSGVGVDLGFVERLVSNGFKERRVDLVFGEIGELWRLEKGLRGFGSLRE